MDISERNYCSPLVLCFEDSSQGKYLMHLKRTVIIELKKKLWILRLYTQILSFLHNKAIYIYVRKFEAM